MSKVTALIQSSKDRFRWHKRGVVALLLVFVLLCSQFLAIFPGTVHAASSPWSQSDWSGGGGQTSWSQTNRFSSSSNLNTAGDLTLSTTEKLTNTGFEENLDNWRITDPDAQALIAAMNPAPDAARQAQITTMVINLKAAGIWNKLDAMWMMAAHSEDSAVINWKNPGTHNLTAVNSPTFTVDEGFQGNGSSSYLNTNFVPSTDGVNFTLNDASMGTYSRTNSNGDGISIGGRTSSNSGQTLLNARNAGEQRARFNIDDSGNDIRVAVADSLGLAVAQRTGATAQSLWKDGVSIGANSNSSGSVSPVSLFALALNNAGSPSNLLMSQLSFIFVGGAMTEGEQAKFYDIVQTYLDGVGAAVWDSDVQDIFDAMSPEPNIARKLLIDKKVRDLKAEGIWSKLDAMWVMAAHSQDSALINWKSPGTFNLTPVNSPTFTTDEGFQGNGSSSYLNTNFVPSTDGVNYTLDDVSFGVYSRTNVAENSSDIDARDGTVINRAGFLSRTADGNFRVFVNGGSGTNVASADSRGLFVARRTASNAEQGFKNGVQTHSSSEGSTGLPAVSFSIGRRGDTNAQFSTRQYALAFVGGAMTEGEQAALYTTVQAYLTQVEAHVGDANNAFASFESSATAERDTTTTFQGSGGSAKLVTASIATNYTQSVNVGDTNAYNLVAHVRKENGGVVTSSDVELFSNNATIATTVEDVGGGWYKLIGTLTGSSSAREYGVQIKVGKTVYVDDLSLNRFETIGTLTSSIFDTEFAAGAEWGTLTYNATTPGSTSVVVKVRTSNSSSMSGAAAFSSCDAASSGSDISSNNCVTDGHRYIQYQVTLTTTDTLVTPTFEDISIGFSTFDTDAPSISLNPLTSPTPNNKPSVTGTATDSNGTVSSVQFQMDSTSDLWSSCTANDGAFDEASEAFTCTVATALSDGSHTMYVRATDSNGNTTAPGSERAVTFVVDTTPPVAPTLVSPAHETYTNARHPTFRIKKTTDATTSVASYELIIKPAVGEQFSLAGTIDHEGSNIDNSEIFIRFNGEYIEVRGKTTATALPEGTHTWQVVARDQAGNAISSLRTIHIDLTAPTLSHVDISSDDLVGTKDGYEITTTQTPTITGTISDNILPDKVEVTYYKQHFFFGSETDRTLTDTKTLTLDNPDREKSLTFALPSPSLDLGKYIVEVKGIDKAGNKSAATILSLQILSDHQARQLLRDDPVAEERIREKPTVSLPELEKTAKVRRELEAEELKSFTTPIGALWQQITAGSSQLFAAIVEATRGIGRQLISLSQGAGAYASQAYNRLPGALAQVLEVTIIRPTSTVNRLANATHERLGKTEKEVAGRVAISYESASARLARVGEAWKLAMLSLQKPADDAAGYVARTKIWFLTFHAVVIDPNATRIENVYIEEIGRDYVVISWETNHYTKNNKINYGKNLMYGRSAFTDDYTKRHVVRLEDLEPGTQYFFEVMSQNKNYAYDAFYTVETLEK